MRRLIRADLRRLLTKPTTFILPALVLVYLWLDITGMSSSEQIDLYKKVMGTPMLLFFSIPIFLGVYGDELKSTVLISIIGRGYSRKKVIFAKLLDCTILLSMLYLIAFALTQVKNTTLDFPFSTRQTLFLLLFCVYQVIKGIGYFALSSLVLFGAMSSAGGMLVLFVACGFSGLILRGLQSYAKFPFFDLSFEGLIDKSLTQWQAGAIGWQIIPSVVIYMGIVLYVGVKIFDRRELEL